jgi:hypothetical protein
MNIESQKADLWLAASLRNAKEGNYKDREKKIAKGVERVSVAVIIEQCRYIQDHLLPGIEEKHGRDHANYKFFSGVARSLLWAICLVDRNEFVEARHYRQSLQYEILTQHCEKLERQFNKYATMEDLFLSSGLEVMAEGIAQRARDLLDKR